MIHVVIRKFLLPLHLEQVNPGSLRPLIPDPDRGSRLVSLARHQVLSVIHSSALSGSNFVAANSCGPIERPFLLHVFIELTALAQTLRQARLLRLLLRASQLLLGEFLVRALTSYSGSEGHGLLVIV